MVFSHVQKSPPVLCQQMQVLEKIRHGHDEQLRQNKQDRDAHMGGNMIDLTSYQQELQKAIKPVYVNV